MCSDVTKSTLFKAAPIASYCSIVARMYCTNDDSDAHRPAKTIKCAGAPAANKATKPPTRRECNDTLSPLRPAAAADNFITVATNLLCTTNLGPAKK